MSLLLYVGKSKYSENLTLLLTPGGYMLAN